MIGRPKCQDDGIVSTRVGGSYFVGHDISPPTIEGVHVDSIGRLADLIVIIKHEFFFMAIFNR
jgi:hypothetical protein